MIANDDVLRGIRLLNIIFINMEDYSKTTKYFNL